MQPEASSPRESSALSGCGGVAARRAAERRLAGLAGAARRLGSFGLMILAVGLMLVMPARGEAGAVEADTPAAQTPPAGAPAEDEPLTKGEALLLKLRQGGVTVLLLLVVSVFGLACALERVFHLRLDRIAPRALARRLDELTREGRLDDLAEAAEGHPSTLGRVAAAMTRHRELAMPELSSLAGDLASREMKLHLLRAYPLMICATLSPLLGLFGTVAGMIGAFDKVAAAGSLGDASMLGGDISKALITTAAGLVVAIPALGLYHYFRSRTNLLAILLEEQVSELISHWHPAGRAS